MKLLKLSLLGILVSACAAKETGSGDISRMPRQTPAQEVVERITPMDIDSRKARQIFEKRAFENGLEVFAVQKASIPMVTISITVRNGAFVETEDLDGLAHFYEHMFFKANERYPSQRDFMQALNRLGVELGPNMNAYTSTESVRYFFTLQSHLLDQGLEFMSHALIRPSFQQEELEREREVILSELDMYDSDPSHSFFQNEVLKNLFSEHYTRKNIGGSREVIRETTQEKMREIQNQYYVPNNSSIFVVGHFEPNELWASVERHFGPRAWSQAPDPFTERPIPAHPPLEDSIRAIKRDRVQTVTVTKAFHGPSFVENDRETVVFDLLGRLLNRDSSRFQKELVDSGLATTAGFSSWTQRHTSLLMFSLEAMPEKAQAAASKFQSLIAQMSQGGFFNQNELAVAKTGMEASAAYDTEVGQRLALGLGNIWSSTGSLDYYVNYIEMLRSIELKDIDQALKKYIGDQHFVVAALLPEEAKEIELSLR
ncbi:MAG: insulinase family protein [Bradymonadales bacterium]|nr:MAG: insulinase family protein [Bradymonadales bacterium]